MDREQGGEKKGREEEGERYEEYTRKEGDREIRGGY